MSRYNCEEAVCLSISRQLFAPNPEQSKCPQVTQPPVDGVTVFLYQTDTECRSSAYTQVNTLLMDAFITWDFLPGLFSCVWRHILCCVFSKDRLIVWYELHLPDFYQPYLPQIDSSVPVFHSPGYADTFMGLNNASKATTLFGVTFELPSTGLS